MNQRLIAVLKCSVLPFVLVSLGGCAVAPQQFVHFADQSRVVEDTAKARIYVMRPGSKADELPMKVYDNGDLIGQTGSRSYLCWERDPGHAIIVGEVVPVYSGAATRSKVELSVLPGKVHYIIQHERVPVLEILTFKHLNPRNELEIVDEANGTAVLKKCKPPK